MDHLKNVLKERLRKFFVPTWLVFAGPVTYICQYNVNIYNKTIIYVIQLFIVKKPSTLSSIQYVLIIKNSSTLMQPCLSSLLYHNFLFSYTDEVKFILLLHNFIGNLLKVPESKYSMEKQRNSLFVTVYAKTFPIGTTIEIHFMA